MKRILIIPFIAIVVTLSQVSGVDLNRLTAAIQTHTPQLKKPKSPSFKNWGLSNEHKKSHINAPQAWKIIEGDRKVIVAVIDTGIDPNHKDLKDNLWRDGKRNFGWDFVTNKPNPTDTHGHGTHVSGILGAQKDTKSGVSGVSPKVSIMAVRYYSDENTGVVNLQNTVKAIHYAVDNGAKIINYSGGGPEFSREEYLAILKAEKKGVLIVSAAGNERRDIDLNSNSYYPSSYDVSNILSVAATDIENKLLSSSNWGKRKVDVAAPGENIYSTLPGNKFGYMSGTSQATAFVSGLAALLLAKKPSLTPKELKALIMKSVDPIPALSSRVGSGGRVNAFAALESLIRPESSKKTRLIATGTSETPFSLQDHFTHPLSTDP